MNINNKELDNFMQKIKERERLLYITIADKYSNNKIKFSIKNSSTYFRGTTLFTKEPITIEWIKSFKKNSIFFDIGANIGVYSLYAALYSEVKVYSFEPESNALLEPIVPTLFIISPLPKVCNLNTVLPDAPPPCPTEELA